MMRIEDDELRSLFKTTSEERIQAIDNGLLQLEKQVDASTLEAILREAHSLKGDSNMLGLQDLGSLAHQIEHILASVKRGEQTLDSTLCDRLARGMDAVRHLVHEAVTGEPAGIDVFHLLADLMGANAPEAEGNGTPDRSTPERSPQSAAESSLSESLAASSEELSDPASPSTPQPSADRDRVSDAINDSANDSTNDSTDESTEEAVPKDQDREAQDSLASENSNSEPSESSISDFDQPESDASKSDTPKLDAPESDISDAKHSDAKHSDSKQPDSKQPDSKQPEPPDVPSHPEVNPEAKPPQVKVPNTVTPQQLASHAEASARSNYRIETVRVPTHNLDHLMTQAGELTVTQIRVAHRLTEVDAIAALWEEWSRDLFLNRFLFDDVQAQRDPRQLSQFYARAEAHLEQLGQLATRLNTSLHEDVTRLESISDELEGGIRTLRLLPLSTIFNLYPRLVRDLGRQEGKAVDLVIEGGETQADKRILEDMKDPLMHMIRNAIDHGIESPEARQRVGKPPTATVRLRGYQTPTHVVIEVQDDGRGLDVEAIKETALRRGLCRADELDSMNDSQIQALILSPGFSTRTMVTEVSGRGVGLDVLRSNVERLKGTIEIESKPGQGCTIRIRLGTTLATAHVLIVTVQDQTYALPVEAVQTACLVRPEDIFCIEGRQTIIYDNQPISVSWLADLLELPNRGETSAARDSYACIILYAGAERLGVFVDALIDEQDVMLKPQSQLLQRVRNVSGATILGTGAVCMVLNPADLIQSVRRQAVSVLAKEVATAATVTHQYAVLLVEDSIATRIQEKRILEAAGYEVVTAVDGLDGFTKLQSRAFDAVISDVQMPHMDGLELTERIRQHREYSEIPVILVTTLASDDDRRRGADAGANAYITKGSFNQDILLDTLQRLI